MLRIITIMCGIGLISGCVQQQAPSQPMIFGIPEQQWNILTSDQQNQVIAGYNRQNEINNQQKIVSTIMDTARSVINK